MRWQRTQSPAFNGQASGNRIGLPRHRALLIGQTACSQVHIEGFQIIALWKRYEVVSARIAHQIFDASLLPASMHIGKERLKAVDAWKVRKKASLRRLCPCNTWS